MTNPLENDALSEPDDTIMPYQPLGTIGENAYFCEVASYDSASGNRVRPGADGLFAKRVLIVSAGTLVV